MGAESAQNEKYNKRLVYNIKIEVKMKQLRMENIFLMQMQKKVCIF